MKQFNKMYGVVGTEHFSKGGHPVNDGKVWVEVQEERPTINHKLQPDLTWELDPMAVWEKEITALERTTIPRWFEDHLMDDHGGKSNNPYLQSKLDQKVIKRADKP